MDIFHKSSPDGMFYRRLHMLCCSIPTMPTNMESGVL